LVFIVIGRKAGLVLNGLELDLWVNGLVLDCLMDEVRRGLKGLLGDTSLDALLVSLPGLVNSLSPPVKGLVLPLRPFGGGFVGEFGKPPRAPVLLPILFASGLPSWVSGGCVGVVGPPPGIVAGPAGLTGAGGVPGPVLPVPGRAPTVPVGATGGVAATLVTVLSGGVVD
jgi:hypothetical protein